MGDMMAGEACTEGQRPGFWASRPVQGNLIEHLRLGSLDADSALRTLNFVINTLY